MSWSREAINMSRCIGCGSPLDPDRLTPGSPYCHRDSCMIGGPRVTSHAPCFECPYDNGCPIEVLCGQHGRCVWETNP